MKNEEFYTTNNPKSFKDQFFDLLKKSPNNLPNKLFFGKEKNPLIRYLLECFVKVDLEKEKINSINVLEEKMFWHPNGIEIVEEVKICDHCHEANQNLLLKIESLKKRIKKLKRLLAIKDKKNEH